MGPTDLRLETRITLIVTNLMSEAFQTSDTFGHEFVRILLL